MASMPGLYNDRIKISVVRLTRLVPFVLVGLTACGPAPSPIENTKSRSAVPDLQKAFDPEMLCGALNDAGLVGSRWKVGSTGFGCSTNELPIGQRDGSSAVTSAVWYEVRGTDPSVADTIVLGGDVRVPDADAAVRAKLVELAGKLLVKLNQHLDDNLRVAIEGNSSSERRAGPYVMRYASEVVGKVRENRLTIQRPI
jgi:hypothetical protein